MTAILCSLLWPPLCLQRTPSPAHRESSTEDCFMLGTSGSELLFDSLLSCSCCLWLCVFFVDFVFLFELHVMRRGVAEIGDLFFTHPAHLACGTAEVEIATREFLAFGDEAACAEQHVIEQHGAVEDHRADADQAAIANGAAVQHHAVTKGDLVADLHGVAAGSRGIGMCVVDDRALLHTGARADADTVDVAAQHRHGPYRRIRADHDG